MKLSIYLFSSHQLSEVHQHGQGSKLCTFYWEVNSHRNSWWCSAWRMEGLCGLSQWEWQARSSHQAGSLLNLIKKGRTDFTTLLCLLLGYCALVVEAPKSSQNLKTFSVSLKKMRSSSMLEGYPLTKGRSQDESPEDSAFCNPTWPSTQKRRTKKREEGCRIAKPWLRAWRKQRASIYMSESSQK